MKKKLNQKILDLIDKIELEGGEVFLVGGFVRDFYLKRENSDIDLEVYKLKSNELKKITMFKSFDKYGILKDEINNIEIAIPREEKSTGKAYNSFEIFLNENLDKTIAAKRRDFTVNTIMYRVKEDLVIDNYNGIYDIEKKVLRKVSDKFKEDPLRSLRAIRFSFNLDFKINKETLDDCYIMIKDLEYISKEKKIKEFKKILSSRKVNIKKQKETLNLMTSYIGPYNKKALEKYFDNEFEYEKRLLKFITLSKSDKIKEFLSPKDEKLLMKEINIFEKFYKIQKKEELIEFYFKLKNDINYYVELFILYSQSEYKIESLKKIDKIIKMFNKSLKEKNFEPQKIKEEQMNYILDNLEDFKFVK